MMKRIFLIISVCVASLLASCGGMKQVMTENGRGSRNPFGGDVHEMPNAEIDTDDWFGASGVASGPKVRIAEIYRTALTNGQNIIRQKMKHAYKGAVDDYMNSFGNNAGTDYQAKMEAAGTQIIDVIVGETREVKKPLYSDVDDKGNTTCYLGLRVYKKDLADKLTDAVANVVSEDEKLSIRFQESQFRERMKQSFKDFKENN